MLTNNWTALIITFCIALLWLRSVDFSAAHGWIDSVLARKIIHIGTGPIFVLCWLLFNNQGIARWLAVLVPLLITIQFILVGAGVIKDQEAVKAMSRSGDRREILRGPFFYGLVFILLTLIYWRTSPIGIAALMILCVGDGLADLIGSRSFFSSHLPWSGRKTWQGSLAMFLGGWFATILVILVFSFSGLIEVEIYHMVLGSCIVAFLCALVESLPYPDIDNLTVPLTAICAGYLFF